MKLAIAFLLSLSVLISACRKEEVLTEGEKTAQTIQSIVRDNNITTANLYSGNARVQYEASFSIEGEFLIFRTNSPNQYYNLAKVNRFDIAPNVSGGPKVIQFYF